MQIAGKRLLESPYLIITSSRNFHFCVILSLWPEANLVSLVPTSNTEGQIVTRECDFCLTRKLSVQFDKASCHVGEAHVARN